jgi:hypothetical protein
LDHPLQLIRLLDLDNLLPGLFDLFQLLRQQAVLRQQKLRLFIVSGGNGAPKRERS